MMDHRATVDVNGKPVATLADILPSPPGLRALFVAKTPAPKSVSVGHYFQGRQGKAFWNRLRDYRVFEPSPDDFEDNSLAAQGFGITDIVKVPRSYGNEPSADEYKSGLQRILDLIELHNPYVTIFVYKKVLDQILKFGFDREEKAIYGFNHDLEGQFRSKLFVFPMPSTPCRSEDAHEAMCDLRQLLGVPEEN